MYFRKFTVKRIWIIVWCSGLVVVERHRTIALIILDADAVWAVDR